MLGRVLEKFSHKVKAKAAHITSVAPHVVWPFVEPPPTRLLFSPVDIRPGTAEKGRWLAHSGIFTYGDDQLELHNANWMPDDVAPVWISHLHGFDWLRDLRALGGNVGRRAARMMLANWMDNYPRWDVTAWRADILGARLANWMSAYDFYGESASDEFQEQFFDSLHKQARHLTRALPGSLHGLAMLRAIRGLAYVGLCLEGREAALEQALTLLHKEIDKQILTDGGHVSRNPAQLFEAINILVDIRCALQKGGYPNIAKIQHALDRAVPALRFFRHGDLKHALFNGVQEGDPDVAKSVLLHSGSRVKALSSLPHTGFERIAQGRGLLIMDAGKPPAYPHDEHAHAAPLAFEYSYGRDRIFVNCGTHPTCPKWQDALRSTGAHNALTIDHRNACEIHKDGSMGRKPRVVQVSREELSGAVIVDACHDGYVPLGGITHRRRMYLANQGGDLRGEETLNCAVGLSKGHDVTVRFHLHPKVLVSLVQGGTEALLRLPSGPGFRFTLAGEASLTLENSVYLGEGLRPRKTKQIVLTTTMAEDTLQLKWALQRE